MVRARSAPAAHQTRLNASAIRLELAVPLASYLFKVNRLTVFDLVAVSILWAHQVRHLSVLSIQRRESQ